MDAPNSTAEKYRHILGVRFFTGAPAEAAAIGLRGGLVVVPAAPALVELPRDEAYRQALQRADLVIADSGLMVLIWRLLTRDRVQRVSGLEYLKLLLAEPALHAPGAAFWIMPDEAAMSKNLAWLNQQGHPTRREDCYLAPHYGPGEIEDAALRSLIEARRPAHVFIAIGGGTQERLGYALRQSLGYRPGIHCIGAAVGFLSGTQVRIPAWADYFYLGWLFRCLHAPRRFIPRYWKARKLVALLWKYGERAPA